MRMTNIDIIIRYSGLPEKYNCTLVDIKRVYIIWKKSFAGSWENFHNIYWGGLINFILMMHKMEVDLKELEEDFIKDVNKNMAYLFEVDLKKMNGTYEEWLKKISAENERDMPLVEQFLEGGSKFIPPLKYSNNFN